MFFNSLNFMEIVLINKYMGVFLVLFSFKRVIYLDLFHLFRDFLLFELNILLVPFSNRNCYHIVNTKYNMW